MTITIPEHVLNQVKEVKVKIKPEDSGISCLIVYYWQAIELVKESYSQGFIDGQREKEHGN